jgi:glutamyl-tRNA synthetase
MEDDTKIEDVVNTNSKFETKAVAEIEIKNIKQGEIIQLERRGFFYVDKVASENELMTLHFIPDGRTKAMSVVSTKVDAKVTSKGVDDPNKPKKEKKEKKDKKENKDKGNQGDAKPEDNPTAKADN